MKNIISKKGNTKEKYDAILKELNVLNFKDNGKSPCFFYHTFNKCGKGQGCNFSHVCQCGRNHPIIYCPDLKKDN